MLLQPHAQLGGVDASGRDMMPSKALGGVLSDQSVISIVDDDSYFLESMGWLVKSLGYAVNLFSSPRDFLASSTLDATACLIADVQMPSMSGVELHRHLIDSGRPIPTILVTAFHDDDVKARALSDGVLCYLRKPVDDRDLMRCLYAALWSGEPPDEPC
jgi:FixJ family two-component response regulator